MSLPTALLPFVPGGGDFALTRRLLAELGCVEEWAAGDCAGFRWGAARFILQDFGDRAFAENYMLRVEVPSLDAWWQATHALGLEGRYPGVRLTPPKDFPWGREANLIDPAGVCWHIAQA